MGNYTNKYGINTHGNVSMSNLNHFNHHENCCQSNMSVLLYGIGAPCLLNFLKTEMSLLP